MEEDGLEELGYLIIALVVTISLALGGLHWLFS